MGIGAVRVMLLCLCLPLASCESGNQAQQTRDVSGRIIGDADRRPVEEGNSTIQLPTELGQPTKRTRRNLANRSDELVEFRAGILQYQRLYTGGFVIDSIEGTINRMLTGEFYRRNGFPEQLGSMGEGTRGNEKFYYAVVEGSSVRCMMLQQFMRVNVGDGIPLNSPGNAELKGSICATKSGNVADFEQRTLRVFEKVRIGVSPGI